jgi:CRP-like cAMP-binding protein
MMHRVALEVRPRPEVLLAAVPMFAAVPSEDLRSFAQQGQLRRSRAGAIVFSHGDDAEEVFCLVEGRIQMISTTADGRAQIQSVLGPGQLFGHLEVIGSLRRTASAECLEDSAIWGVGGERFLAFLDRQPVMVRSLLAALARQVIDNEALVEDLLFLDLRGRVAKRLLALVSESWEKLPSDGTALPWDITQTDLASLSGGSRENVSRVLSEFGRRGMVERQGRRYVLRDIHALRRLAGL